MKRITKILCFVLVLAMAVSLVVMPASAKSSKDDGTKYQTVFIHGLLGFGYNDNISNLLCYWGMTSGNMIDYLNGEGYDVVNASVGPCSSCWDRCCELYAQLTGTQTDYGAAHSSRVEADYANSANNLKHDRYGMDYTGGAIVDNWGPIYKNGKVSGWYDNKLNLIGHSFGGPTSTMFVQLLAYGDADEIAWGKQQAAKNGGDWHDYVSPLFWGDYDGQYLINSVTSLAGVLNGTTFLSTCKDEGEVIMTLLTELGNTIGRYGFSYIYDFQLDHFGISNTMGVSPDADDIKAFFQTKQVEAFLDGYDNALYDLSIQGCNDLKSGWETFDNIYYFSYAGNLTNEEPVTGNYLPDPSMLVLFWPFATKIGRYDYSFEQVTDIYGNYVSNITKEWLPNDGMVNTISARYPIGAAQKAYNANDIDLGIWQWKDMRYDHMTFCGGLLDPNVVTQPIETRRFYNELMWNIENTTPVEKGSSAGSGTRFVDVPADYWCYDAVEYVYNKGLMKGVSDTCFNPDSPMTRAQFVTVLYRMAGSPSVKGSEPFADVADNYWARDAIIWAYDKGIIEGYDASTFGPNDSITRAQMVAMLYRYEGSPITLGNLKSYSDASFVPDYATKAFVWATKKGVISGYQDGTIGPNKTATRGHMATIIARYDQL